MTRVLKITLAVLILQTLLGTIFGQVAHFEYEFENVRPKNRPNMGVYWMWRSQASGEKTLRLDDEDERQVVTLTLCSAPRGRSVLGRVENIRYSNDGPSDRLSVRVNGVSLASYTTIEKWNSGNEWNVFRNSGRLGRNFAMREGNYTLQLSVRTDKWGVELDKINISATNQRPEVNLICDATLSRNS